MPSKVLIVHLEEEQKLADALAAPLREIGYDVHDKSTVLVGDSDVNSTAALLQEGAAIVICGTQKAAGNSWVRRLLSAPRSHQEGRVFIVQMEEQADLQAFAFGEKIARYWQDPAQAVSSLIASIRKHHPLANQPTAAERRYRALLLETCDIINLASLPEQNRHLAYRQQELTLRNLYIPLRLSRDSLALYDLDHSPLVSKAWSNFEGSGRKRSAEDRASLGELLAQSKRLIVLGDPGGGKTTLTRWIATAYLLRWKQQDEWQDLPDVQTLPAGDLLPIMVRCRDLDQASIATSLDGILTFTLRRAEMTAAESAELLTVLRERLAAGTGLLILDGLDEVTEARARARLCEQLEKIVIAFPAASIIVTSRLAGYREMNYRLGRGFAHVTLADLTRQDKDDFAARWCQLTELPERRQAAARELIHDIHSSDRIERLTGNPMLLTTMALVKRKVGKLPHRRADLYSEALQVLLNWRREVDEPLDRREALPQLEYLAYDMCQRGVQQVSQSEILDLFAQMRAAHPNVHAANNHTPAALLTILEARTGVLVESGQVRQLGRFEPLYEFRHLTFQEFLAALALAEGYFPLYDPAKSLAAHVAPLAGHTFEAVLWESGVLEVSVAENWRESLRLCAAICRDRDVDSVLLAILTPQPAEGEAVARARAVLAVCCLADEPYASAAVAEQVFNAFAEQLREFDSTSRTQAHEAAIEIAATHWRDSLQQALGRRFWRDVEAGSDAEQAGRLAGSIGCASLQNESRLHAWLADLDPQLTEGEDLAKVSIALTIASSPVTIQAEIAPATLEILAGLLSLSSPLSVAAAWALLPFSLAGNWRLSPADIAHLVDNVCCNDTNPQLACSVALLIGVAKSDSSVELLGQMMLFTSHKKICESAAAALQLIGSDSANQILMANLRHNELQIRQASLLALSQGIEPLDRKLLTHRLDGSYSFLDPREPIRSTFVEWAAQHLHLPVAELRSRYEKLAARFPLHLEWQPKTRQAFSK